MRLSFEYSVGREDVVVEGVWLGGRVVGRACGWEGVWLGGRVVGRACGWEGVWLEGGVWLQGECGWGCLMG